MNLLCKIISFEIFQGLQERSNLLITSNTYRIEVSVGSRILILQIYFWYTRVPSWIIIPHVSCHTPAHSFSIVACCFRWTLWTRRYFCVDWKNHGFRFIQRNKIQQIQQNKKRNRWIFLQKEKRIGERFYTCEWNGLFHVPPLFKIVLNVVAFIKSQTSQLWAYCYILPVVNASIVATISARRMMKHDCLINDILLS